MSDQFYQSPICLNKPDSIKIEQCIDIYGTNNCANFDCEKKIFIVTDNIMLKIDKKQYKLIEYHFHIPGEHLVNNRKYPSEVHYVFMEYTEDNHSEHSSYGDLCGCSHSYPKNVLVIGRLINDTDEYTDLTKLQVKIPSCYYEYDGTLTTGDYTPVKWIIGKNPIFINETQLLSIAKTARPLQDLNGRIVLYSD
jgi:carbonic anhydrase